MALNIALSGAPGAGKSTIARRLAGEIGAVHIEIDLIDAAIRRNLGALAERDRYRAAYGVARALAPRCGNGVVLTAAAASDRYNPPPRGPSLSCTSDSP